MSVTKILSTFGNIGSRSSRQPAAARGLFLHLAALLLFVLFFLGTMLALFPKAQLRDYVVSLISRQTGQHISIAELSLSPLLGVKAKDIAWQPPAAGWPPVRVGRLSLSPVWTSLFGKNPAGRFHAAVAGGSVDGRIARDGGFDAMLANVNLAPFIAAKFPFPPSGSIGGTVTLEKQAASGGRGTVIFDLAADDLKVAGLDALGLPKGELALGRVKLRGKMAGQAFNIEELSNEGGDLSIGGRGIILVGNSPERCRLSLQIEMRSGQTLAPTLHDLLQLGGVKAEADGSYHLRLGGTLARPILR